MSLKSIFDGMIRERRSSDKDRDSKIPTIYLSLKVYRFPSKILETTITIYVQKKNLIAIEKSDIIKFFSTRTRKINFIFEKSLITQFFLHNL